VWDHEEVFRDKENGLFPVCDSFDELFKLLFSKAASLGCFICWRPKMHWIEFGLSDPLLQKTPSESPRFQPWDERRRCSAALFGDGKGYQFVIERMSGAHPTGSGFVPVYVMV
jgi:hypothetical protein